MQTGTLCLTRPQSSSYRRYNAGRDGYRERKRKNFKNNCIRFKEQVIFHAQLASRVLFELQFRLRPDYAGEIWKQRFHSENESNVFRPHYAGEFWKRNYTVLSRRPFWICVWEKLDQGNHVIVVTSSFSKCFPSIPKRNAGVFKFLQFEEQFWKAPFSWRISLEGKANCKLCAFKFLQLCVAWALAFRSAWKHHTVSVATSRFFFLFSYILRFWKR